MSNEIIVAIITGLFTFAGVVVTNIVSNKKVQYQLHEQQKITDVVNYCKQLVKQGILAYTYTNNSNMKGVTHINI